MMHLPETLALLGLFISSLIFYVYAHKVNRKNLTMDGFTLSNKTLSNKQFSNTFTASSLSLSTVLVFFISTHQKYGPFLLICPLTFILGQCFFFYIAKKNRIDFHQCRTISDLIYLVFSSKKIARLISMMTIISFIGLSFIELYIGSMVLTFLLPNTALWQTFSFFAIGITVLMYIRLGGYKAIVKTDKWQLSLMALAIMAILIFSISLPSTISNARPMHSPYYFSSSFWDIVSFILWILFNNMTITFTKLSYWQRISASSSIEEAWQGQKKSIWKTVAIWTIPVISLILLRTKGYEINSLTEFLSFTRDTSYLTSIVLFPLVITGFASALFSSADVAVIAIVHALSDQNTFLKYFEKLPYTRFKRYLTRFTIITLIALSVIYWIKYLELTNYLIPLIYASLGQMTMLFPLSIYSMYHIKQNKLSIKFNKHIMFCGILLGWVCILSGAWVSINLRLEGVQQITTILSMLIICVSMLTSVKMSKRAINLGAGKNYNYTTT